jgi:hypothetical protein
MLGQVMDAAAGVLLCWVDSSSCELFVGASMRLGAAAVVLQQL